MPSKLRTQQDPPAPSDDEELEEEGTGTEAVAEPTATSDKKVIMVPKGRLDEEIGKRRALEGRLVALEAEKQRQLESQLAEQGQFKDLAEERAKKIAELQPKADRVDQMENTLKDVLNAQVELIPEERRGLIPVELSTAQQLAWIARNKAMLVNPAAPDIGAGRGSNGGTPPPPPQEKLTPEEKAAAARAGLSEEEYLKYR